MGAAAGGVQAEERPRVLQLVEASPECLVGAGTETGLRNPSRSPWIQRSCTVDFLLESMLIPSFKFYWCLILSKTGGEDQSVRDKRPLCSRLLGSLVVFGESGTSSVLFTLKTCLVRRFPKT